MAINLNMKGFDAKKAFDTRNLDQNNPGTWPIGIQAAAFLVAFVAVCAGGYFLTFGPYTSINDQLTALTAEEAKEVQKKQEFTEKAGKAAGLPQLKAQMVEMERSFDALLQKLPKQAEIGELLQDISQTGIRSGLEFELFKPGADSPKDFYIEIPINITVTGSYHEFGDFVSGLSELSRIVTVHDVALTPKGAAAKGGKAETNISGNQKLTMTLVAKTYKYSDEAAAAAKGGKKGGAKK
jgi:type IV pilus assembly protein PilO